MSQDNDKGMGCERRKELVQIGVTQPSRIMTIRELFEQMANQEREMISRARERAATHINT